MALTDDDCKKLWNWQLEHLNPPPEGPATLPARVWLVGANMGSWTANATAAGMAGQLQGMTTALQLALAGKDVSLDDVRQAAEDGAKTALENSTIHVDIHVAGAQQQIPGGATP